MADHLVLNNNIKLLKTFSFITSKFIKSLCEHKWVCLSQFKWINLSANVLKGLAVKQWLVHMFFLNLVWTFVITNFPTKMSRAPLGLEGTYLLWFGINQWKLLITTFLGKTRIYIILIFLSMISTDTKESPIPMAQLTSPDAPGPELDQHTQITWTAFLNVKCMTRWEVGCVIFFN